MDIFKTFATDEKLETEGRWVDFDGETSFKIAASGNKNFKRVFQKALKAEKGLLDPKTEAAEKRLEEVFVECLAKTVLVDWKGPVELNGENLGKYSVEGAIKLLKLPRFRDLIDEYAKDEEGYKAHQEASDEKN